MNVEDLLEQLFSVEQSAFEYWEAVSNYESQLNDYSLQSLVERSLGKNERLYERDDQIADSLDYLQKKVERCKDKFLAELTILKNYTSNLDLRITDEDKQKIDESLVSIMKYYLRIFEDADSIVNSKWRFMSDESLGLNELKRLKKDIDFNIMKFNSASSIKILTLSEASQKSTEMTAAKAAVLRNTMRGGI